MADVIPTIVPLDFADLGAKAAKLSFAPTLHIDIADGVFAPNTTWMPSGEALPNRETVFYEAHLMVKDPKNLGAVCAISGARRVIAHVEAFENTEAIFAAFDAWRDAGAKEVGLSLLLETPLEQIEPCLPQCDVVHLMTIASIGTQGIPFESRSIERIHTLRKNHPSAIISVDGGVSEENIAELARAGASRFCVGAVLAQAADPAAVYKSLVEKAHAI